MGNGTSSEDVEAYLNALREGPTPFERFVARRDIKDVVDVPTPRKQIDTAVLSAIAETARDKACRLIPVLGSVGAGKTHTYWAYKDKEVKMKDLRALGEKTTTETTDAGPQWTIVYVPNPLPPIQMLQHMYTCIIDELGRDVLQSCAQNVVNRWAGNKRSAKKKDIDAIITNGLQEYPGSYVDCIKVLAIYELDKTRHLTAERWLFGEELKGKDLDLLEVKSTLGSDDVCWAMLKLLTENSGQVFVFFFDDFFEASSGPERRVETHFFDVLREFYSNVKNAVLLLTDNKDNWPNTLNLVDRNLRSFMAAPLEIMPFTVEDVKLYFAKSMEQYWRENNLTQPQDPLFPLNNTVLEILFQKAKGNPRNTVKLLRLFVDKVVSGEVTLAELATDKNHIQIAPQEREASQKSIGAIKSAAAASQLPESELVERLRKTFRVSDRISIPQLAQQLKIEVTALWDHVLDWADRYRFRIDNDVLVIKDGDVEAFLRELAKVVK